MWWLALTAGYLLLVSSPTGLEGAVGVVVGALAAAVAVMAQRAFQPVTTVPPFIRGAALLPLDLVADAVSMTGLLLTGRAFRADCGTVDEMELPDDDATRAWAVLLTSAAPGSLATEVEDRDDRLVLRRHLITRNGRAVAGLESR